MTAKTARPEKLRVIIVGGGVAALEAALALRELAPEQTDVTVIALNPEFVYRPLTVTEPFAFGRALHYPLAPKPFHPVIHAKLLTYDKPLYMTAQITGGHGFSSQVSDTPTWSPPSKIAAQYLAPYLDKLERDLGARVGNAL